MSPGPDRRRRDGFALIEVLVALALLSVGIVAVLGAVVTTMELQSDSMLRHRAGLVLREKLDESVWMAPRGGEASGAVTDGRIRWSVHSEPWGDVGAAASNPKSRLHRVVVEVEWTGPRRARSIQATQIVCVRPSNGTKP